MSVPAIPITLNIPQVPCGNVGNTLAWLAFFDGLKALLGDQNFFKVLTHCTAAHSNCVSLSTSNSPGVASSVVGNPNIRVLTPCAQQTDGGSLSPVLSQNCIDCVFKDTCSLYNKPVSQAASILRAIACPESGKTIDQSYIRTLCKRILDNTCPGNYDASQLDALTIDQPLIDKINDTLAAWRSKFPFLCKAQPTSAKTFWDTYGWIIVACVVGIALCVVALIVVRNKTKTLKANVMDSLTVGLDQ